MNIEAIRAASARVTAPGQPYEVTPETIDGVAFRVFKNAPANLRELYRSSLVHGHKDFYVYQDERYSFGESWRQSARVAQRLLAHRRQSWRPRRHCRAQLSGVVVRVHGHHVDRRSCGHDERVVVERRTRLRHRRQRSEGIVRRRRTSGTRVAAAASRVT